MDYVKMVSKLKENDPHNIIKTIDDVSKMDIGSKRRWAKNSSIIEFEAVRSQADRKLVNVIDKARFGRSYEVKGPK